MARDDGRWARDGGSRGGQPTLHALARFDVYRRALEVAGIVRGIDVRGDLRAQMIRAAESVVLNIAEAQGRSGGDCGRALEVARGSLYEVAGALDLAELTLGERSNIEGAREGVRAVAAMLARLCARSGRAAAPRWTKSATA